MCNKLLAGHSSAASCAATVLYLLLQSTSTGRSADSAQSGVSARGEVLVDAKNERAVEPQSFANTLPKKGKSRHAYLVSWRGLHRRGAPP